MKITVRRYGQPNTYELSVSPDDDSWVLFQPREGAPELWHQVVAIDEDGATVKVFAPAD